LELCGPHHQGKKCLYDGRIDYGWLQVDNKAAAEQVSSIIETWNRELKCETASATWGRFMEPMKDILWGIKHLLVPAILIVMTLILSNTFSITVRERVPEMAVLKVLGFSGNRVLLIVLGECALVGILAGTLGSVATFALVNGSGGVRLPDFPVVKVPYRAFWWGPALGMCTALAGAIVPAWGARNIKPTHAFAHVA
jgi:putative ABC transport system permease protein